MLNYRILLILLFMPAIGIISASVEAGGGYYGRKAKYLIQFAEYAKWPKAGTLTFCVIGPDLFGKTLDNALKRKKAINGRKLRAKRISSIGKAKSCNVLFVSKRLNKNQVRKIIERSPKRVLTVADRPGFIRQGGMINFFKNGKHIRFEINNTAAKRARIKLSSKLLNLARKVI
ncbi:MAG: YfiR family protein [Gammaproteobacteria bacterium]|nr:YfiR family protein [Gammaproteobacteria bacterium]